MLEYLVTSKSRRRLLTLLWRDLRRGSVNDLAERADLAFAGAHRELKAMTAARLVVSSREHGREVFAANLDHPQADVMRSLVGETHVVVPAPPDAAKIKGRLASLGAPLRGVEKVEPADVLEALVDGTRLARHDAVVARTLPVCLWKQRASIDAGRLDTLARSPEEKHALAFFLELTGELGNDRRLLGLAEGLRDRRMSSLRPFFQTGRREEPRPFPLAEKWGFTMNMELDSFRGLFAKFVS